MSTHVTPFQRMLLLTLTAISGSGLRAGDTDDFDGWLKPQDWIRDTDGPILTLGRSGQFDDTHIFAPAVIQENGRFLLWYCGSRGRVSERVFRLGLASSKDGRQFARHPGNPVYEFGDDQRSVLTPALLRTPNGHVLRENARLRMWFSSTAFADDSGLHTLHDSTSDDGITWSAPSPPLLKNVYAPTIIRDGDVYRMWFVDVGANPWIIRHAVSTRGRQWQVTADPCLIVDQAWESSRLFYPTVLKIEGLYLMWYGSYWKQKKQSTATGFAVSTDGLQWTKHPLNPVLRPDPKREWESNYVTSQAVIRLPDGAFRIWYASRRKPPFLNKYFAINTALWNPDVGAEE